jgi:hypothetical protein
MHLTSGILVDDVYLSMLLNPWDTSKRVRHQIMQSHQNYIEEAEPTKHAKMLTSNHGGNA